jgi:hypothetical protein
MAVVFSFLLDPHCLFLRESATELANILIK